MTSILVKDPITRDRAEAMWADPDIDKDVICKTFGVSNATLYRQFGKRAKVRGSKTLETVMERQIIEASARLSAANPDEQEWVDAAAGLEQAVRFAREHGVETAIDVALRRNFEYRAVTAPAMAAE